MTFTLEVSRPFQWKPNAAKGAGGTYRAWWGFVAVGIITIPWVEFVTTEYEWREV